MSVINKSVGTLNNATLTYSRIKFTYVPLFVFYVVISIETSNIEVENSFNTNKCTILLIMRESITELPQVSALLSCHFQEAYTKVYLKHTAINLTFRRRCIVIYSYNKSQRDALFLNFILVKNSTCFGQTYCPLLGILILYSQQ
jgi:hypothetical protein